MGNGGSEWAHDDNDGAGGWLQSGSANSKTIDAYVRLKMIKKGKRRKNGRRTGDGGRPKSPQPHSQKKCDPGQSPTPTDGGSADASSEDRPENECCAGRKHISTSVKK